MEREREREREKERERERERSECTICVHVTATAARTWLTQQSGSIKLQNQELHYQKVKEMSQKVNLHSKKISRPVSSSDYLIDKEYSNNEVGSGEERVNDF